ncbi:MAG: tRNA (adenosine(37)-N6)-dimethylallyltransferase MiaA [Actinomycetaceae bacterium]|nr:tRNA (adenosine(37)-N6)-dimethylallyltransferase MiaA [Actinomycetaceae bacterium]
MIIAIVGATATGKTALSLEVAERLGGASAVEIISADAMQLYRGMDIGTAKLPLDERRGIAHHQIDVLDVREEASVAAYQRSARADIADIQARGKIPIIVGGSGLYISAVLDKLDFPGHDPQIRAALEAQLETEGIQPLLTELKEKDPQAAAVIAPENTRRIIRALEVIRLTGKPFTPRFPRHTSHYEDVHSFLVTREKTLLDETIKQRTHTMFEQGLVEETRHLLTQGLEQGRTASTAIGYAQAIEVIRGTMTLEEAEAAITQATIKLTKKQGTWFRADKRLNVLDLSDGDIVGASNYIVKACTAI